MITGESKVSIKEARESRAFQGSEGSRRGWAVRPQRSPTNKQFSSRPHLHLPPHRRQQTSSSATLFARPLTLLCSASTRHLQLPTPSSSPLPTSILLVRLRRTSPAAYRTCARLSAQRDQAAIALLSMNRSRRSDSSTVFPSQRAPRTASL